MRKILKLWECQTLSWLECEFVGESCVEVEMQCVYTIQVTNRISGLPLSFEQTFCLAVTARQAVLYPSYIEFSSVDDDKDTSLWLLIIILQPSLAL